MAGVSYGSPYTMSRPDGDGLIQITFPHGGALDDETLATLSIFQEDHIILWGEGPRMHDDGTPYFEAFPKSLLLGGA